MSHAAIGAAVSLFALTWSGVLVGGKLLRGHPISTALILGFAASVAAFATSMGWLS